MSLSQSLCAVLTSNSGLSRLNNSKRGDGYRAIHAMRPKEQRKKHVLLAENNLLAKAKV